MRIFSRLFFSAALLLVSITRVFAAPAIQTLNPPANAIVSNLKQVSITFTEAVAGVDSSDLLINNQEASTVTGSGAGPYVFQFTEPTPGTVQVRIDSGHGITNLAGDQFVAGSPWNYTLKDTIAPTVVRFTPAQGSTVGAVNQAEVLFNEPVTGIDASDLQINGTLATSVTGSDAGPYVFTFPQPLTGTVFFEWSEDHNITDLASPGNPFPGGTVTITRSTTGTGTLIINEFLASNTTGLTDEDGDHSDWVEIYNSGTKTVNLTGWALTGDATQPNQWFFPSWTLNPGNYLVVFTSTKDRKPPQATGGQDNPGTAGSPRMHANFRLSQDGGDIALIPPGYPRTAISSIAQFPEQRSDFSYGLASGQLKYFSPPTPGTVNNSTALSNIADTPNASVNRGFFKDPFQLNLSTSVAGATIRYTTDGTEPTATNGTVYSAPLNISTTTVLRAATFATGFLPSKTVTLSYIFLDQTITQGNTPAGYPTTWGTRSGFGFPNNLVPADYEMDMDPMRVDPNNPASAVDPVKLQRLKDGLRELPIISIVMPVADIFGSGGFYFYPNVTNKSFPDKKCSIEMILPDGSTAFAVTCGIGAHGNASRQPEKNPKHGFKLKFRGEFGANDLSYQVFPDSPVQKFDDLILRADFGGSWRHWSDNDQSTGNMQRTRATRTRDPYIKECLRDMGGLASHSRFTNLFINGIYWGTYDITEQPTGSFAAGTFGGEKSDYDVYEQNNSAPDSGSATVYNAMRAVTSLSNNANYEQMKQYLDVTEFIDYTLLHFFVGHQDWGDEKNWFAIRQRAGGTFTTEGKFKYIPWDGECHLFDLTDNRVPNGGGSTDVPSGLHTKLDDNAQYRLDFADRVHKHMIAPGGALTSPRNIARWQKWQAIMDKPIVAESARWGDYRRDVHPYDAANGPNFPLFTRENQWMAENTRIVTDYLVNRNAIVMNQLTTAGLYPNLAAPEYHTDSVSGPITGTSTVSPNYVVAIKNPGATGTIYYTTDGSDPRVYYAGTISSTAASGSGPLTLTGTTTIKSRVFDGSTWSALNEAAFTISTPAAPVRITEIMYNPPGGNALEYLEIMNVGTQDLDVSGWSLTGVDYLFPPGTILTAGRRIVLASNDDRQAWQLQYSNAVPYGYFGGSLSNGGERIAILDANVRTVTSVDYDDDVPWPAAADGGGYSLENIDPNGDPDDPFNWKASANTKGTPGSGNSPVNSRAIELSEVFARNVSAVANGGTYSDYVELRNPGVDPVNITGWSLLTTNTFVFPTGTTIAGGGYLVVYCDSAGGAGLHTGGSGLNDTGGDVLLKNGTTLIDAVRYGQQATNYPIGRVNGQWTLVTPSPNGANSATPTAALSNLSINEWYANSRPGESDWIELYNQDPALPIALPGVYVQTSAQLYQIKALSFMDPHSWLQLFCNEDPGANQLDFKLPATGTTLSLLDPSGALLQSVTFGSQLEGVSQGRNPDGSNTIVSFAGSNSPGAANYVINYTGPVLNEVVARNVTGAQAPWGAHPDWFELYNPSGSGYDLSGMRIGTSPDFTTAWIIPDNTTMDATSYIAFWCDASRPPDTVSNPDLNTGFRLIASSGGLYLFTPAGQLVNQIEWGFQITDSAIGVDSGTWKLLATPTRGATNDIPATLGSPTNLRINEWAAGLTDTDDWFELYNLDTNPVSMAGLYLSDDPSEIGRIKFQVAPLSFIAGHGWVQWKADGNPENGRDHTNFNLNSGAEYIRVSNNDAAVSVIDAVSFGLQTTNTTEGRIPDGQSSRDSLVPTPGAANIRATPVITTHPVSQTKTQGGSVTFTVSATGLATLSYQWRFNNNDISLANSSSLTLSGLMPANDGSYTCRVTNSIGNATSNAAALTVQSTFSQWQSNNFTPSELADGSISGPNGDPDLDGIFNYQEFLHHLDPKNAPTASERLALPQVGVEPSTGDPQFLTVTYRLSSRAIITGLDYQTSATLDTGTWSIVTPSTVEQLGPDPVTGDPRLRAKFPILNGEVKKFLRLQVTP